MCSSFAYLHSLSIFIGVFGFIFYLLICKNLLKVNDIKTISVEDMILYIEILSHPLKT